MKKSLVLIAAASIAIVLSGCGGTAAESKESNAQSSSNEASVTPTAAPASASSFKDGVLITPDLKIAITDHKVLAVGAKGNEYGKKPVIAFWYTITNLSAKDVSPMNFMFNLTAYQDNNPNAENKLEVGGLPDDRFLETQMEKVKNGGTVENAIAYELDDEITPVDLVASTDLGVTEIGKTSYKLQ
ncbi:hypothetical protein QFZ36_000313 [Pseudarthrobacter siccitolerans]|uniref:DUF5067 domain-containing protein n=1 Tax=Pseudarthrobacter siccitolerans TaxID=861266 RepID=A0ABU0PGR3_9MICC|nr:DUF5067 domain-containing protein [Pseudarthrobacter siccitolerans]MDQ0672752.1 hypothetical protein [Pseudarthrobacter siccitolerans]